MLLEGARQRQQVSGVVGSFDAEAQHRIVAGALTFVAQTAARDPHERVEPVSRAQELGRHLHQPVPALNMRQLMTEHDAHARLGPIAGVARENDFRPHQSPCDKQRRMVALQQQNRATQPVAARQGIGDLGPRSVCDLPCPGREPDESRQPDDHDRQVEAHAHNPQGSKRRHRRPMRRVVGPVGSDGGLAVAGLGEADRDQKGERLDRPAKE